MALGLGERQLLHTLHTLAGINNETEIAIASLERLVEMEPSDVRSRFSLAYAYGNHEHPELCLYHYANIPAPERDAVTWNNLGVVRDKLSLPTKSVQAYQRAKSQGETLAMSNLALKFASAGFLEEAQRECDKALSKKNYHRNIGTTLATLKAYPEQEDRKEADFLREAEPISHFYQCFGASLCEHEPSELKSTWQGPDCELHVSLNGVNFEATGNYNREANALASPLSLFKAPPPPERWQVTYQGIMRGRTIEARVSRVREGEPPRPTGLLSLGVDHETKVLMLIASEGYKIRAMEISKAGKPRFYSLKQAGAPQQF